jgi:hypothetical protein
MLLCTVSNVIKLFLTQMKGKNCLAVVGGLKIDPETNIGIPKAIYEHLAVIIMVGVPYW